MYLNDTNGASELRKPRPHGAVVTWVRTVDDADLHLSAVTLGEIQAGIELTREPDGPKAAEIEEWLEPAATTYKVLPMDPPTFRLWAKLMHRQPERLREGAMVAATAARHKLVVLTRNARDLQPFGVEVLNPFGAGQS